MKKILAAFLFFLAIMPFALSVGVSPPSYEYIFEPGMSGQVSFSFRNNLDRDITIVPSVGAELGKYVTIMSSNAVFLHPDNRGKIDLNFTLPDSIGEPGWHSFVVIATEQEGTGGTVGARGEVVVPVRFFVQYPGKKLGLKLDAHDCGIGQKAKFDLIVSNLGKENISNAKATVDIFRGSTNLGTLSEDGISVDIMQTKTYSMEWDCGNNEQGVYLAKASLVYDGNFEYANDSFRIGTLDIDVINYTRTVEKGQANKFLIEIASKWNQNLENIFADVDVLSNGQVISSFSAATQLLEPWQMTNMTGFLDATNLARGKYPIEMRFQFSSGELSRNKTVSGEIEVVDKMPKEEEKAPQNEVKPSGKGILSYATTTNILIFIVILLVIINIIILFKRKKKKFDEYA